MERICQTGQRKTCRRARGTIIEVGRLAEIAHGIYLQTESTAAWCQARVKFRLEQRSHHPCFASKQFCGPVPSILQFFRRFPGEQHFEFDRDHESDDHRIDGAVANIISDPAFNPANLCRHRFPWDRRSLDLASPCNDEGISMASVTWQ